MIPIHSQQSMFDDGGHIRHFDGDTYEPKRDHARLSSQLGDVQNFMADGKWHTLEAIANGTDHPQSSVSARLRDLRKIKFGGLSVERRYVSKGLFEYRIPA